MSEGSIAAMDAAARRQARLWLLILLGVMLLAAVAAWLWTGRDAADRFDAIARGEAQITESRAAAVADWVERQRRALDAVASNPSLVPYLATRSDAALNEGLGGYVQNYLRDVAEREGFTQGLSQVPANVTRADGPGLAIVDARGRALVQVGGPLPPPDDLIARAGSAPAMVIDGAGRLRQGSALRLLRPLAGAGTERLFIYGVRLVDNDLLSRLVQPGEPVGVAEQALVAQQAGKLWAVTTRGSASPGESLNADPLVMATLAKAPAVADSRDAAGVRFLGTARPVAGSDWQLLRLRPAGLLLGDALTRRLLTLAALLGAIGLAGSLGLLAWRQSVSAQLAQAGAAEARARQFLGTLADQQPTGIYVIDRAGLVRFANRTARSWQAGRELAGTSAHVTLGAAAPDAERQIAAVHAGEDPPPLRAVLDGRRVQLDACALLPEEPAGDVLLVAQDLTALLDAQDRKEASQLALVDTLTGLIDARDPGSRGHSHRVSLVAAAVAETLEQPPTAVETVRTAGLLMNLGKILVPSSLLTRATPLTPDEMAQVRTAMAQSAALLRQVPFDGPVAATLEQVQGEAGGTGLAAILRLANAYVGMVSPRAHRAPLPQAEALAALRQGGHDAALVSALAFWLDSRDGSALLLRTGE